MLGEVTARMHRHARRWQRPPGFTRLTWDFDSAASAKTARTGAAGATAWASTPAKEALFARTVAAIGRRLAAYGKGPDRFGLIHCDLRLANLLIDGETVKAIDFDDCGFSWYMYDAATPVSFYEHEPQVPELIARLGTRLSQRRAARRRGRGRDPDLRHAAPPAARRLDRLAQRDRLAQSMGVAYTEGTVGLCERYLARFG